MKTSQQQSQDDGKNLFSHIKPDTLKWFFFGCWAFFGIYYGDVFHQAWQNNGFSTDAAYLRAIWEEPYGSLWIIGRTLFQAFRFPFWGGALLSVFLTLISWLFGYVCKLRGKLSFLRFIPAFIYIYALLYYACHDGNFSETGMVFGIPFCALFILILQAIFIRSFSKKHICYSPPKTDARNEWITVILIFLLTVGAVLMNEGAFS